MKQNTGWLAAIGVAVAALFGFSVLPSRNGAPQTGSEAAQQNMLAVSKPRVHELDVLKAPCEEIEKRISEFLPQGKVFAPQECFESGSADQWPTEQAQAADVQFVIATFPNPVLTHFALQFDRLTVALQQAAQDQGYNYDSSWLPWGGRPQQYRTLADQEQSEKQEYFRQKQPGVLVFRGAVADPAVDCTQQSHAGCPKRPYDKGLVLFVVGENPTGGIDGEQFHNAVHWMTALRPSGTTASLHIIGPFFSGSFSSLAQLLNSTEVRKYLPPDVPAGNDGSSPPAMSKVQIFSGSASSSGAIEWFQQFLKEQKLGQFITFQESDDLIINRYCRLLHRQGYDTSRLAIVSEDETAYGAIGSNAQVIVSQQQQGDPALYECTEYEKDKNGVPPLNLFYPRDIASLRSAYAKQRVFGTSANQNGPTGLPQNLSEGESSEHDTIRSYGGEQNILSQEATLFALVNLLKAHRIEFILLRSSNSLDQIFLTQFFARTYPDARVIIMNSDVMLRRSTETPGFRGTMTLSTYPLLTWEQDWTYHQLPGSKHSHRAFPDANSEGLYLATRFLIGSQNQDPRPSSEYSPLCLGPAESSGGPPCDQHGSSILLQDYGPPSWLLSKEQTPTRPSTWLSVLAAKQVWPLAVINEDTVPPERPEPPRLQARSEAGSVPPGHYNVRTTYYADNQESVPSHESSISIGVGETFVVRSPRMHPKWAQGYRVYVGHDADSMVPLDPVEGWKDVSVKEFTGTPQPDIPNELSRKAKLPQWSILHPAYTGAKQYDAGLLWLPLTMRACFSFVFMWCIWHLYCCWTPSQMAFPRSSAYFAAVPGPQHRCLIFFGSALFALMAIALAMLTGSFSPDESRTPFLSQLGAVLMATLTGDSSRLWAPPFVHQWRMTVLYWLLIVLPLVALVGNYLKTATPKSAKKRQEQLSAEQEYKDTREKERSEYKSPDQAEKKSQLSTAKPDAKSSTGTGRPVLKLQTFISKLQPLMLKLESAARVTRSWLLDKRYLVTVDWGTWLRSHPTVLAMLAATLFIIITILLARIFYYALLQALQEPTRIFVFWRSVNLFSGVSPLLPFLLLIIGMYVWFWFTLSGLALFNCDRPQLPRRKDMDIRLSMFTRERAGYRVERVAKPLSGGYGLLLPGLFLAMLLMFIFFTRFEDFSVRSLGDRGYGEVYFVWLSVCVALIVADAFQLLRSWSRLHQLLANLDRLPLRRTVYALKGFSWGTVWKMSGGVLEQRYRLLSRQMESFRHLKSELEHLAKKDTEASDKPSGEEGEAKANSDCTPEFSPAFYNRLNTFEASGKVLTAWYVSSYHNPEVTDITPLERHQKELAKTAAAVCNEILIPAWQKERKSLIQDVTRPDAEGPSAKSEVSCQSIKDYQRLAEEFFALPYLGFVQNILGRMRTIAMGMLWLFIAATISVVSYPFDPRPLLGGIFLFVFLLVGTITVLVYAQMHRDTTLSHITNTNPGELGLDFWTKLLTLGIGPLLALLTTLFPELAGSLVSWFQPSLEAIK